MTVMAMLMAAASAAAPCPAVPAALPADLSGWRATPLALAAGETFVTLPPGRVARVALRPVADLRFAVPPTRASAGGTHGGTLAFDVPRAGTWRVALSGPAWIDVVGEGRALASTGHGHEPDCSGIRKIVDFALKPGRHLLQIAGSADPAITVLVAAPR